MINELIQDLQTKIAAGQLEPIAEKIETETYTPYAIATLLNETLKALKIDRKPIPPQYMYNYSYAGRINGVKAEKGVETRYTEDEVKAFITKFVTRETSK